MKAAGAPLTCRREGAAGPAVEAKTNGATFCGFVCAADELRRHLHVALVIVALALLVIAFPAAFSPIALVATSPSCT